MRLPFAWKFGLIIAGISLVLAGGCFYIFYSISYEALVKQIGKNLLHVGRLGGLLFDEEAREAIKRLDKATAQDSLVTVVQVEAMQSGTTMLSLSPENMQRYHESRDFQLLMKILQRIALIGIQDLEPRNFDAPFEDFSKEPLKITEAGAFGAYLSVTIKESPDRAVTKYLASAMPFPAADGWPGNPVGNLTKGWILPPTVHQGKSYVDNQLYTDSYYTSLSAIFPIIDIDGTVFAYLGIDYVASKERNALIKLRYLSLFLLATGLLIIVGISMYTSNRLHRSIGQLARTARRMGDNDFSASVAFEANDEFSRVGRAFNQMVAGIGKVKHTLDAQQEQLTAVIACLHDRLGMHFRAVAAKTDRGAGISKENSFAQELLGGVHQIGSVGLAEIRFLMGALESERCDLSLLVEELRLLGNEHLAPRGLDVTIATEHPDVLLPVAIFLAMQGVARDFFVQLSAGKPSGRCSLTVEPSGGELFVSVQWESRECCVVNAGIGDAFQVLEAAAGRSGWRFEKGEGDSCSLRICTEQSAT